MADHGVVCSVSRPGNVWDNAAMESFFSLLKTERATRRMYRTKFSFRLMRTARFLKPPYVEDAVAASVAAPTPDAATADVFDYIERLYNPKRRHSTIG